MDEAHRGWGEWVWAFRFRFLKEKGFRVTLWGEMDVVGSRFRVFGI
jgi:hypothetical protein